MDILIVSEQLKHIYGNLEIENLIKNTSDLEIENLIKKIIDSESWEFVFLHHLEPIEKFFYFAEAVKTVTGQNKDFLFKDERYGLNLADRQLAEKQIKIAKIIQTVLFFRSVCTELFDKIYNSKIERLTNRLTEYEEGNDLNYFADKVGV